MKVNIGLVTRNSELADDLKNNIPDYELSIYKNIDTLSKDSTHIIIVDYDEIGSADSTQFYLSRLRKKILDIPVFLILRVNTVAELDETWFFDDFILYPFRKWEVKARLKRLISSSVNEEDEINIGQLKINLKEYAVYLADEKLDLTYKEFELLRLFLQNRGVVFSRKDVLNRIWGMEYIGGTRTVDVHIRRLRSKIGDEFNSIIETVRNVGYKCRE
ncbi:MAG TPA: response regulator transcription factor [Spirochaetota bacterium]|nr:response regulator transcription factor [Spirochaetota bacterium]HPJ36500.1 response regulator transcription factor [Spirochaetota bacterium]